MRLSDADDLLRHSSLSSESGWIRPRHGHHGAARTAMIDCEAGMVALDRMKNPGASIA